MTWTKRHSQNAVAAKWRRRMERAGQVSEPMPGKAPRGRSGPARWQIQIRDLQHGDSLTLQLHASPWPNRWVTTAGEFSSAHLGRALILMLGAGS